MDSCAIVAVKIRSEHEVTLVRPEAVTAGRLVLTNKSLYFHPQRTKVGLENRQVSKQGNSDISSPYKSTKKGKIALIVDGTLIP